MDVECLGNKNNLRLGLLLVDKGLNNLTKSIGLRLIRQRCVKLSRWYEAVFPTFNQLSSLNLEDMWSQAIPEYDIVAIVGDLNIALIFKLHVSHILRHTFSRLKVLYSSRFILNFKTRKKLCESLVFSILSY